MISGNDLMIIYGQNRLGDASYKYMLILTFLIYMMAIVSMVISCKLYLLNLFKVILYISKYA